MNGAKLIEIFAGLLSPLPARIKRAALRAVAKSMSAADRRSVGLMSMFGSIENLDRCGLIPRTVIDVGANVGEWTAKVADIFPSAQFHLFEAQAECEKPLAVTCERLSPRARYTIGLLGAERRVGVPFFSLGTGSSVLEETTSFQKTETLMDMLPLDEVMSQRVLLAPVFLKMDVQGYELEILKGAPGVLSKTDVVLMEVSTLQYNRGAPLMAEVVAFMSERGFVPYDVCGRSDRWSDGAMFQLDMMFCRTDSLLRAHRKFWPSEQ